MATSNVNRPQGFKPSRYLDGSPWNGATTLYGFSASQANDAYLYDACQIDTTNRAIAITDVYAPGIPVIKPAVATLTTNAFRGIIAGFVPSPEFNNVATASLGLQYRAASTARYALVVDDAAVIFVAQEAGQAYVDNTNNGVNKTSDLTYAAGSTITGLSGAYLNTPATSGVKAFRILRYTQTPDNFGFVAADNPSYAKFDVMIANSDLAQANVGA